MPGLRNLSRGMTKDPADADWYISKFTPQPLAASSQPIQLGNPAAAALPRAYIFFTEEKGTAEEDPLTRIAERLRSDPGMELSGDRGQPHGAGQRPTGHLRGALVAGISPAPPIRRATP